ncbi:hypothetical protein D9M71_209900 [compost metagenome]
MAPAGPEVPVVTSMPMAISDSCSGPAGRRKATASSVQLMRQKAMARAILRSGDCRHMRSLSIPQMTMPAPPHSTMMADTTPA